MLPSVHYLSERQRIQHCDKLLLRKEALLGGIAPAEYWPHVDPALHDLLHEVSYNLEGIHHRELIWEVLAEL